MSTESRFKLRISEDPEQIEQLLWARRYTSLPSDGMDSPPPLICPLCGEKGQVLAYPYGGCYGLVNWHILFDCCSLLSESASFASWLASRVRNGYAFPGESDVA